MTQVTVTLDRLFVTQITQIDPGLHPLPSVCLTQVTPHDPNLSDLPEVAAASPPLRAQRIDDARAKRVELRFRRQWRAHRAMYQ